MPSAAPSAVSGSTRLSCWYDQGNTASYAGRGVSDHLGVQTADLVSQVGGQRGQREVRPGFGAGRGDRWRERKPVRARRRFGWPLRAGSLRASVAARSGQV
jgi:hypothetical protein